MRVKDCENAALAAMQEAAEAVAKWSDYDDARSELRAAFALIDEAERLCEQEEGEPPPAAAVIPFRPRGGSA